ncbi:hypothetical protein BDN72DRAFT_841393 [Pluteus cervinus]|uniref:Uncharacterized protein n=1 Tax=Pluteus cervinus TaxID=181527 RepID=A0ACD3ASM2_9AGAR|nr:hypothetical protein BDN72DRAFT_841393 [Pluteus cervinus]
MADEIHDQAREKIDAEILVLRERIRSLCSSRNNLSYIHRLPPEVMAQIFMQLQHLYRGKDKWATHLPRWIQVTRVSQRWRNIAQSCKTLYSTILTRNLPYSQEMLKRSGCIALELVDGLNTRAARHRGTKEFQDLIVAALPRVRSLSLDEQSSQALLPHLETSNLVLDKVCVNHWESFTRTMFPNSLRYLYLEWCRFESYEWLFSLSNMVELTLTADDLHPKSLALDTLLSILDGMPRLTSLRLWSVLDPGSTQVSRASPITPKLQYLNISEPLDSLVECLPWLTFAPRFTLEITPGVSNSTTNWTAFLERVGQHIRASSMILRKADLSWIDMTLQRSTNISCSEGVGQSPCLQIFASLETKDLRSVWLKQAAVLPFDNVETLTMGAYGTFDSADWDNSRWHLLPKLRQLDLRNDQTSVAYLEHLVGLERPLGETNRWFCSGGSASFPSLEELSLSDIHYDRYLKSNVQGALDKRTKRGVKLRKLVFHDCSVSCDSIKQLSQVVDEVEQLGRRRTKRRTYLV